MAVSTPLAIASLSVAAAGTAYGVYAGEQGKKAQKKSLREQEAGQRQAENLAMKQQREAADAAKQSRARTPEIGSLLASAIIAGKPGATQLTGPGGIASDSLARNTLLGG